MFWARVWRDATEGDRPKKQQKISDAVPLCITNPEEQLQVLKHCGRPPP